MTAYTKSTNFATKDTLTSGDPLKIVKGTEINTEFDNIATAVNSKSDTASPTFTGTVTIPVLSVTGVSTLTGVATLTAQPILSSLTASSAVATDASKGLVSVTNTGTGNNVLATSPTLTTPALGTPSALVLTNATGLPRAALPTGSVLQVVNATYSTSTINSTTTYADTGLTATITPTSATSKILVLVNQSGVNNDTINSGTSVQLLRTSTSLVVFASFFGFGGNGVVMGASACYLDSPATTSATTYKTQFKRGGGSNNAFVQDNSSTSTITLLEIAA
jgi:hypothetical protein